MLKPRIFISAVTRELGSARQLVANTLTAIGYEPIWQDIFPTDAGDLREMLRTKIDSCHAVLQLVGDAFGAEPPTIDPQFGRVSYTQYEALYPELGKKKKVYYLFLDPSFPRDNPLEAIDTKSDEKTNEQFLERQKLQTAYKERIRTSGNLRSRYTSSAELENGIYRLRNDLDRLRRNIRIAIAGIFLILLIIIGGVYAIWHGQNEQVAQQGTQGERQIQKLEQIVTGQAQQTEKLESLNKKFDKLLAMREVQDVYSNLPREHSKDAQFESLLSKAFLVLDEKYKQPPGTMAREIPRFAENLLQQSNTSILDRASALFVQGKFKEAEEEALKAKDAALANVDTPITEAIVGLIVAGNAANEQFEPRRALDHYRAAAVLTNKDRNFLAWSTVRNILGLTLLDVYDLPEAEKILSENCEGRLAKFGPDDPNTGIGLNNLAQLYQAKGDYAKALPLLEQALAISEKTYGKEHADVAMSLNNMAMLYYDQGEYAKALPLFQRALAIYEKIYGKDHIETVMDLNNLGLLYQDQAEYAKAQPLFERALAISEKVRGKDHPDTATGLNNLGMLYQEQAEYAKALPLFKRALAIREKTVGRDHPDTALSLNNLGLLYFEQGEYDKVLPLYERALAINEKVFGPAHPSVALCVNNIALVYYQREEYDKALPLFERALAIHEKVLGKDHPSTATSLSSLGLLYEDEEEYAKALPLFERALAIREKVLGKEHPDYALTLNNLASLYYKQSKYVESLAAYQQALAINEKALGKDHPKIATLLSNIAEVYKALDETEKAIPFYERAIAIEEKSLGEVHLTTATYINNLAELYRSRQEYAKAIPLYERALATCEKLLGKDNDDTKAIREHQDTAREKLKDGKPK